MKYGSVAAGHKKTANSAMDILIDGENAVTTKEAGGDICRSGYGLIC
jgi:hypothetical protein